MQNARRNTRAAVPKTSNRRLRGRGDYSSEVKSEKDALRRVEGKIDHLERSLVHTTPSSRKAASMAGRALGSFLGQGDLGAYAGEGLSKLFGFGDYRTAIKGNSLMGEVSGNAVPKFSGDGKRGIRMTEREFIGNVVSGPAINLFDNNSYVINPTDPNTFPWLSKIAHLFDQWEPHGVVFEFHTTSSTFNGTSQALGAVIMATDYDVNDPIYASKQIMENADYACSSVPSSNLLHGIECDPRERPLQVMYCTDRAGQLNFSQLGNFQVATAGCSTANVTLGELWISYDITFYKKQLASPAADVPASSYASTTVIGGPMIIPTTLLFSEQISLLQEVGVGTRVLFPPSMGAGRFLITSYVGNYQVGDNVALDGLLVNCVLVQTLLSTAVAGSPFVRESVYDITAPDAYIRIGLKSTVGASVNIAVMEVASTFRVGV